MIDYEIVGELMRICISHTRTYLTGWYTVYSVPTSYLGIAASRDCQFCITISTWISKVLSWNSMCDYSYVV